MRAWITNGQVAWEIPPGRVASFFVRGAYQPPEDWRVHKGKLSEDWTRGDFGEMRKGNHESSCN